MKGVQVWKLMRLQYHWATRPSSSLKFHSSHCLCPGNLWPSRENVTFESTTFKLDRARTTSGWDGKLHVALVFMHRRQMILQMNFPGKAFVTDIASEPRVWIMHSCNMILEAAFLCKSLWTNVTLEGLDVTNTMNRRRVSLQTAFLCKLPAANLALVSGVRMLRSAATAALSMRRVVVSADRWLVAKRQEADLALDTPCLRLLTKKVRLA